MKVYFLSGMSSNKYVMDSFWSTEEKAEACRAKREEEDGELTWTIEPITVDPTDEELAKGF